TSALAEPGPERLVLGPTRGAAALAGVNGARDHASLGRLPRTPRVLWTRTIAGGLACELLADESGRVIVAGPGRVTQLGPDGKVEQSRSYAFSRPLAAALLNDGTRVLLTEAPELIGISESGAQRFSVRLSGVNLASPGLLPLWDGGVLVALGAWALSYDARGDLRGSAELDERVRLTLQSGRDVVLVGSRGGVYRWDGRGSVRRAGAFGRVVLDAALGASSLIASLADDEMAELSFSTGQVTPLLAASNLPGAARRTLDGKSWLSTTADGSLLLRRGSEPSAGSTELAATPLLWLQDAEGSLATASALGGLVFHRADGSRETLPLRCNEPLSLVPVAPGRIALGCRSGELWLIGEDSARDPGRAPATEQ
ncbi:MAG: hypothetical protein ABW217_03670, partial [Polyangiaceae bacterium]